ncbi:MAG: XRE family transcriptional regulator [Clostridia bacterium]|nr:XRE family transcriptional regulator [Clostridia bacterium]
MDIGSKIKRLRLQLNLSQAELADRCELTKGYISQLENDVTSPSIATLCDILAALGTDLAEFFKREDDERVVFGADDFIEKRESGMSLKWIIPNAQKNIMEPVAVELLAGAESGEDTPHEGEEFGYVTEGKIRITLDKKTYICKRGEAFYYKASVPHKISNAGKSTAKFLWISSPPNF